MFASPCMSVHVFASLCMSLGVSAGLRNHSAQAPRTGLRIAADSPDIAAKSPGSHRTSHRTSMCSVCDVSNASIALYANRTRLVACANDYIAIRMVHKSLATWLRLKLFVSSDARFSQGTITGQSPDTKLSGFCLSDARFSQV